MSRIIDLNADLGEGGPVDRELLDLVTSANVACGFHAGDPTSMLETCSEAVARGVRVGAHPSYADREGFGRRAVSVEPATLAAGLAYQVGAFAAVARAAGTSGSHIKLHGALYNEAAADRRVAVQVVEALAPFGLPMLALAGSALVDVARAMGVTVFSEGFADRAYAEDGTLLPRQQPGAVLEDPEAVAAQALGLVQGRVETPSGSVAEVEVDSICIHGDTPGALELARRIRRTLVDVGVSIRPFG